MVLILIGLFVLYFFYNKNEHFLKEKVCVFRNPRQTIPCLGDPKYRFYDKSKGRCCTCPHDKFFC